MFYPFDRVHIYVAIFQRLCQGHWKGPHLYLTFKSSHVGTSAIPNRREACRDKSPQTFLPRWFPYISGFTVSPPPLRLTVPLVWWQRFLVTERREERDWGPLLGRLCHFSTTAGQHVYQNMKKRLDSYRCGSDVRLYYFWLLIFKQQRDTTVDAAQFMSFSVFFRLDLSEPPYYCHQIFLP